MNDMSNQTSTAYITRGLPGSGKSTWAHQKKEEAGKDSSNRYKIARVSNDAIRDDIFHNIQGQRHRTWSKAIEKMVKTKREEQIVSYWSLGVDVIVDNTHLNQYAFDQIVQFCSVLGFRVVIQEFLDVSVEECIRRDALRTGHKRVGETVIRMMNDKYQKSLSAAAAHAAKNLGETLPDSEMRYDPETDQLLPRCIIVDLDGTLFERTDRGPYDEHLVFQDTPRQFVVNTIKAIMDYDPWMRMVIVSGRSEVCIDATLQCIALKAGIDIGYPEIVRRGGGQNHASVDAARFEIHMRDAGDMRRDSLIKMEIYNKYIKNNYRVYAVFDDRPQVIRECWKVLNLPVFNCGVIDREF